MEYIYTVSSTCLHTMSIVQCRGCKIKVLLSFWSLPTSDQTIAAACAMVAIICICIVNSTNRTIAAAAEHFWSVVGIIYCCCRSGRKSKNIPAAALRFDIKLLSQKIKKIYCHKLFCVASCILLLLPQKLI